MTRSHVHTHVDIHAGGGGWRKPRTGGQGGEDRFFLAFRPLASFVISPRMPRLLYALAAAMAACARAYAALNRPVYHETDELGRWRYDKDPSSYFCPSWSGKTRRGVHLNNCRPSPGWGNTTLCRGIGWSSVPGSDPVVFLDFFSGLPPPSLRGRSHNAFNVMTILTAGEVAQVGSPQGVLRAGDAKWFSAGMHPAIPPLPAPSPSHV